MVDIKSIIFDRTGNSLIINIGDKSEILYMGISKMIDNDEVLEYLDSLFCIIDSWQKEYIDLGVIDGDSWKLVINYIDGNKREYYGKSKYPTNFEAFERLNQKLINGDKNA